MQRYPEPGRPLQQPWLITWYQWYRVGTGKLKTSPSIGGGEIFHFLRPKSGRPLNISSLGIRLLTTFYCRHLFNAQENKPSCEENSSRDIGRKGGWMAGCNSATYDRCWDFLLWEEERELLHSQIGFRGAVGTIHYKIQVTLEEKDWK